jgi:signal peptidase I
VPRARDEENSMRQSWQKSFRRFGRDFVRPFAFVALLLGTVRSSIADWNDVPTGSMNPSILEGDRIFVNKLAYDLKVPFTTWHLATWAEPRRGDVVVFFAPTDGTRMVKRVVGTPGDTIALVDNRLFVNGEPASYGPPDPHVVAQMAGHPGAGGRRIETETLGGRSNPVMGQAQFHRASRDFGPVTVPPGRYFLMGDNRDNSFDSRYYGFVERDQIVGRASGVALSLDPERTYRPRWDRFLTPLP